MSIEPELLEQVEISTRHSGSAPELFGAAWKRAAGLAGLAFFRSGMRRAQESANTKWELLPDVAHISHAIGAMSSGERVFIAALVSLYNSKEGGKLLRRVGVEGLADLGGLDLQRRILIAALVLSIEPGCNPTFQQQPDSVQRTMSRAELFEQVDIESRHFQGAPVRFLSTWKRAAVLAGIEHFGTGTRSALENATTKWDLTPDVTRISDALCLMNSGERLFIAALVSFYNSQDGGQLLKRAGFKGLADLGRLDLPRRTLIATLILNYTGW